MRIQPNTAAQSAAVVVEAPNPSSTSFAGALSRAQHASSPRSESFDRFVHEVDRSAHAMNAVMRKIKTNATMSNEELLAVQMVFYRHAQLIEVAAKGVEKVSSGLRQLAQNQ